jgi:hypothetical protein
MERTKGSFLLDVETFARRMRVARQAGDDTKAREARINWREAIGYAMAHGATEKEIGEAEARGLR